MLKKSLLALTLTGLAATSMAAETSAPRDAFRANKLRDVAKVELSQVRRHGEAQDATTSTLKLSLQSVKARARANAELAQWMRDSKRSTDTLA